MASIPPTAASPPEPPPVTEAMALQLPIFFGEFETEQDICKPYQSSPDNDIARRRIIGSGQIATQLGKFDGITCKGFGG